MEILINENNSLKETIKELENKLKLSNEKLKKYTNSLAHKEYYQEHKDEVKAKGKAYLEKLKLEDPEKLKEYWKKGNKNRKLKQIEKQVENKIE